MPFKIVRNDITKMEVDVIVNTANKAPIYSTGTDTAVYLAAGAEELLAERKKIGYMNEGEVAITQGFHLPAKYIIHAVSPRYIDGESGEEGTLRSCYKRSLELAKEYNCKSIAFPLIATGNWGYPKEEGMRIAVDEINGFLLKNEMLVYLVVFDTMATKLGLNIYPGLKAYIDHHYVCEQREIEYDDRYFGSVRIDASEYNAYRVERDELERTLAFEEESIALPAACSVKKKALRPKKAASQPSMVRETIDYSSFFEDNEPAIQKRLKHASDTFQEYLFYLIELKGLKNSDVYKRAIITKQHFSKIKQNPEYHPDKATAIRLCVGAKLNLDETKDLLARAGYALSPSDKRDIIFSYFIEHRVYDMIEIDIVLEEFGLPCFIV